MYCKLAIIDQNSMASLSHFERFLNFEMLHCDLWLKIANFNWLSFNVLDPGNPVRIFENVTNPESRVFFRSGL